MYLFEATREARSAVPRSAIITWSKDPSLSPSPSPAANVVVVALASSAQSLLLLLLVVSLHLLLLRLGLETAPTDAGRTSAFEQEARPL